MPNLKSGDRVRAVHFAVDKQGTVDPENGLIRDEVGDVISIDDNFTVPPGTLGTVDFVDDAGQVHVKWDNGSTLALIPGKDNYAVVQRGGHG